MTDRENNSDEVIVQLLSKLDEVVVELREIKAFVAVSAFHLSGEVEAPESVSDGSPVHSTR